MKPDIEEEELFEKIKVLNITLWEHKIEKTQVTKWLGNFKNDKEKIHALYLLSNFMYFGNKQMRDLLKIVYTELFKYRIVEKIRKNKSDTIDLTLIKKNFTEYLSNTRFLGIGNPSESGPHLLYFFRQENKLSKKLFVNTHEIFELTSNLKNLQLSSPKVNHYVFIDDFCGSGNQAISYSQSIVDIIKKLNTTAQVDYLMLFATKEGIKQIKKNTAFDYVDSVFELDDSYKCFGDNSRYFKNNPPNIYKDFAKKMCEIHGERLYNSILRIEGIKGSKLPSMSFKNRLGYNGGQLLISFHHNTPDNTLPIIWYDETDLPWFPIFKRYNKNYGE